MNGSTVDLILCCNEVNLAIVPFDKVFSSLSFAGINCYLLIP